MPLSHQGLVPCPLEGTWASQSTLPLVSSSSKVGSRKGQVALVADRNDCFIVELLPVQAGLPACPLPWITHRGGDSSQFPATEQLSRTTVKLGGQRAMLTA